MITISAAKTHRWRGDYNPRWFVLFIGADTATPGDVAFTTREITDLSSRTATTVINSRLAADGLRDIGYAVDENRVGGVAKSGKALIQISSSSDFLGWLESNDIFLDGREVQIYHWDPAETDYTTADLVWSGFVEDVELDGDWIEVRCEDGLSRFDRTAPPSVYTDDTGGSDFQVREELVGEPIPIVLGRVSRAAGVTLSDVSDDGSADRGMLIQFCDPLFSGTHDIHAINDLVFGDDGLVSACGGYAKVKTTAVPSLSDVNGFTLDAAAGTAYFDDYGEESIHLYIDIRPVSALRHFNAGREGDNPIHAVDGNESSAATILHDELGVGARAYALAYQLPRIGLSGTIERSTYATGLFVLHRVAIGLYDGTDSAFYYYIREPTGAASYANLGDDEPAKWFSYGNVEAVFDYYSPVDVSADVQLSIIDTGEWTSRFENLTALSKRALVFGIYGFDLGQAAYALLYEYVLRAYFTLDWPDSGWYADVEGYEDDASGTYTGSANSLIENPAHVAAFMAAKFSNATATGVDISGLKSVAAGARAGWIVGKQLDDRRSILDYLGELGEQSLLWFWVDRTNTVRGFPMTAPVGTELVTAINANDVIGEFKSVKRASAREVATNFVIRYKWNPVSGGYDKALTCSPTASSDGLGTTYEAMCADAMDRWCGGLARDADDIELDWVEDDDTALEIAKKLIRRRTTRPWLIEFNGDVASIVFEAGDAVRLNSDDWIGRVPSGAIDATYRVTSTKLDPHKAAITVKATEVLE